MKRRRFLTIAATLVAGAAVSATLPGSNVLTAEQIESTAEIFTAVDFEAMRQAAFAEWRRKREHAFLFGEPCRDSS